MDRHLRKSVVLTRFSKRLCVELVDTSEFVSSSLVKTSNINGLFSKVLYILDHVCIDYI